FVSDRFAGSRTWGRYGAPTSEARRGGRGGRRPLLGIGEADHPFHHSAQALINGRERDPLEPVLGIGIGLRSESSLEKCQRCRSPRLPELVVAAARLARVPDRGC